MSIKDANVTINVKDLERSISFYQSIGLTAKNQWGNHYAQLTAPGIVIGLHPTDETNLGNSSIGFTVNDFEETKSLLMKLEIQSQDRLEEGGQFLHFNDLDATSLYFIKPKNS